MTQSILDQYCTLVYVLKKTRYLYIELALSSRLNREKGPRREQVDAFAVLSKENAKYAFFFPIIILCLGFRMY